MAHKKKKQASTSLSSNEVHLRHLTVDEALLKLDKYLSAALICEKVLAEGRQVGQTTVAE